MPLDQQFLELPDTVGDTFVLLDRQWRFVYLNRRAIEQAQMPAEKINGQRIWDLFPSLVGTPIEAAYRRVMDERTTAYLEYQGVVTGTWYGIHVYPMRDGIAVYGRDINDRRHAEQALRESEERFRSQYENLPVPTYTWRREGEDFKFISFNRAADAFTGGAIRNVLGATASVLYADEPSFAEEMKLCCEQRGAPVRREMHYTFRSTKQSKDLAVTYVFVPPDLVMVHTEDITERKRAELALRELNENLESRVSQRTRELEAKTQELARSEQALRASEAHHRELAEQHRLLALELEHRIGNNIASILGLVTLMRQRAKDVREYADAVESRLHAMAHVHRLLNSSGWTTVSLPSLVPSILAAMQYLARNPVREEVAGPECLLGPKQAFALALILSEWFTNSCKHGVHSAPGGSLRIDWALTATPEGDSIQLHWLERGGPPITEPPRPSFGTQLAQDLSVRELRGSCRMTFPRDGAEHEITFPPAHA